MIRMPMYLVVTIIVSGACPAVAAAGLPVPDARGPFRQGYLPTFTPTPVTPRMATERHRRAAKTPYDRALDKWTRDTLRCRAEHRGCNVARPTPDQYQTTSQLPPPPAAVMPELH
jgi:hypothetical protein